jgi:hypothetical protein
MFFDEATKTYRRVDDVEFSELTLKETIDFIKSSNGKPRDLSTEELDKLMKELYGIDEWSKNASLELLPQELLNASYSNKLANLARGNHPLNSAISILTDDVVPDGIDKNVVALLAMSHSKSTSGIRNFQNPDEWRTCVDKLCEALKVNGSSDAEIESVRKGLTDLINDPNSFNKLVDQALCIRDGDAMSALALTADGYTIMQTGQHAVLSYEGNAMMSSKDQVPTTELAEQQGIIDNLYDSNGNKVGAVTDNFSKKVHAGELNLDFDSTYSGGNYNATLKVKDPFQTPFATLDAAFERAGEVATYGNCSTRKFVIELPAELKDSELGKWYESRVAELIKAEIKKAETKGYCTDQFRDFYQNMIKIEWT